MKKILTLAVIPLLLAGCIEKDSPEQEAEGYWKNSDLCNTAEECRENGDEYGKDLFDMMGEVLEESNTDEHLAQGLNKDDEEVQSDITAVYRYEDGDYQPSIGEEDSSDVDPFNEFIADLAYGDFGFEEIAYIAEGDAETDPLKKRLTMPKSMFEQSSQQVAASVVHEYGHLLSMQYGQFDGFFHADNPMETTFNADSYLNQFQEEFWQDYPDEWLVMAFDDEEERKDFYEDHKDEFVSKYAAVDPTEELAESFAHFVLTPYKEPETIAEEKVNFFYQFDELVDFRTHILKVLHDRWEENQDFY